ncbi:TetR/AcrR family transcriptional regulator [Ferrovibrio sp.]|uniref:TetR/AcrR family transcriptional regulator n=1 Tax=Ferrovibrio sp. TaxID=1917215 RepID=UPI003D29302B
MVKRTNDPEGLRRRLLDTADRLFQAQGYHGTSMHDLMREAGVTGGALHHHFASKKALGLAVIQERVALTVRETWLAPLHQAASGESAVQTVLADICRGLDERGRVQGCPLNNLALELALADDDFRIALDAIFAEWRNGLAARLRQDGLRKPEAEARASFIIAAYSGAIAMAKTAQSAMPLKNCARLLATRTAPSAPDKHRAATGR